MMVISDCRSAIRSVECLITFALVFLLITQSSSAAGHAVCRAKFEPDDSRKEKIQAVWVRLEKLDRNASDLDGRIEKLEHWGMYKKADDLERKLKLVNQERKACRRFVPDCSRYESVLKISIENDSDVDLVIRRDDGFGMLAQLGYARRHTVEHIEMRHVALASYGKSNRFYFFATFDGEEIGDPNIRREIIKKYTTKGALTKSCVTTLRYRFTNRTFAPRTGIIVRPEPDTGTTNSWAGRWICKGPPTNTCGSGQLGSAPILTITGNGSGSSLRGDYAVACHGSAYELYTIKNIEDRSASGSIIYFDHNPSIGPTGARGVWPGTFSITISSSGIALTRRDQATGWQGSYTCMR